ncbi:MAG: glutamate-5-semialdehyde dehydrogenase [Kiritimatiellae bacterium]|nr:glutamate-5-semialdehyde dehydrogenase [Kiritimatiellia bacterium]
MDTHTAAQDAKGASIKLAAASGELKNTALQAVADALLSNKDAILAANRKDLDAAENDCLAAPLLKRLKFDEKKIADVVTGIQSLITLKNPVGTQLSATELDDGLELYKVTCPIGVIGVIFESRPDALVQISTLCLKSGNALLLKGGSEAMHTNRALAEIISKATVETGIPDGWIQLLETRSEVNDMLELDEHIDLIIPRGSNEFVRHIMEHSNIPVLGHADGICHVYVDQSADLAMAQDIVVDSKCQYVAVCNAAETVLVHEGVAEQLLPALTNTLQEKGVELRGCPRTVALTQVAAATDADWRTEYLDYILSIRVVADMGEAIQHINTYGSGHTDAIVTGDADAAKVFMDLVDSGDVLWNCSTRFSDGFRYGLGAEVGISTNKIHARGPVGLEGLLIYKWRLIGKGHIVAPYADGEKTFTHRSL